MCGIVGIVDLSGQPVPRELVSAMNDRIVHRGPDEDGFWFGDGVGLGMRRLSILDLAGGSQPFYNENSRVISIFNGEIYNFRAIRDDLTKRGHALTSHCDTEVLPHLYEERGDRLMDPLIGMFALAVWDRDGQTLLLARDRLGIKPLHYAVRHGRLYFASELKSFEPCGFLGDVNPEAVYHYLTYGYIPAPLTIYEGVYKLKPGHRLKVQRGEVTVSPYWSVHFRNGRARSEEEWLDELEALLTDSVKLRLISDVPLGAFLSGGVDSSTVVALMSRVSDSPVKTFSIGFDDPDHDESQFARAVAERFGTEHTELTVRPDLWKHVEEIVLHFDEPFADSSAIPTYFLSKLTRGHVTVAMSGDGGDELFAGYDRYRDYLAKRPLYRLPRTLRAATFGAMGAVLPRGTRGKRFLRSLGMDPLDDYVYGDGELTHGDLLLTEFSSRVSSVDPMGPAREYIERPAPTELDRLCMHDIGLYLPDDILTKVDRTSMAVSLEVRVPILDHRVVEFALTLPKGLRLRGGEGKYILKRLLERYLPKAMVHRVKKGFAVPLGRWFRQELRDEMLELLSPSSVKDAGVFNPTSVAFLIEQHLAGKRNHKALLWRLFVYHLWDRKRRENDALPSEGIGSEEIAVPASVTT